MNYIQYLQAGGKTTPSIQEQVVALVQAAVQGDQQAAAQIQKILQAAKSGDKQALQIAQMIQSVMQKMKGTQRQQAGGEMQPQQPIQQSQPQYGNAPIPPPVPQQQDNTSMGTQMYGDSSAVPLSKNDYGAPENNAIDQAVSGAVQNFGGAALSAIGSMRRGGKIKFFKDGGENNYINEIKGSRRNFTPEEKRLLMEWLKEKMQNWDTSSKHNSKEKGGKLNKRCSCKLERRGGKIVEVDSCTGLIIK